MYAHPFDVFDDAEKQLAPLDFESIVNDFVENCANGKTILTREFRSIEIRREDYGRVHMIPGSWALMSAYGSGINITWYLYHSPKHNRLFMCWKNAIGHYGCNDHTDSITII